MKRWFALKFAQFCSTPPAARNRQPVIVDTVFAAAFSVMVTFEPTSTMVDGSTATTEQVPVAMVGELLVAGLTPPCAPPTSALDTLKVPPTFPSLHTVI